MGFAEHIINLMQSLYASQQSNVRVCEDTSEWFKVRRGVRQRCILSPYLFILMGELLMRCAQEGYRGGFKIGGRLVTNLRYADDIVLVASSEEELQNLINRVNLVANDLDMRINTKKTEVMKICDDLSPIRVTVAGYPLSETKSFKYFGAMFNAEALCDEEVKTRLARARGRMGKLVPLWRSSTVSNKLKARLIKTLVWPIATYGSEAWTLNKELRGNLEAFEMQCYRKAMRIPYTAHITNEKVLARVGQERGLLGQAIKRKFRYFGHVIRHNCLEKDIMLGTVPGIKRQGGQRRQWLDDITQWSGKRLVDIVRLAENRGQYRSFVFEAANARSPGTVNFQYTPRSRAWSAPNKFFLVFGNMDTGGFLAPLKYPSKVGKPIFLVDIFRYFVEINKCEIIFSKNINSSLPKIRKKYCLYNEKITDLIFEILVMAAIQIL